MAKRKKKFIESDLRQQFEELAFKKGFDRHGSKKQLKNSDKPKIRIFLEAIQAGWGPHSLHEIGERQVYWFFYLQASHDYKLVTAEKYREALLKLWDLLEKPRSSCPKPPSRHFEGNPGVGRGGAQKVRWNIDAIRIHRLQHNEPMRFRLRSQGEKEEIVAQRETQAEKSRQKRSERAQEVRNRVPGGSRLAEHKRRRERAEEARERVERSLGAN